MQVLVAVLMSRTRVFRTAWLSLLSLPFPRHPVFLITCRTQVEQFCITTPEASIAMQDEMLEAAMEFYKV